MILYSEGATKAQEAEAESILGALTIAYPNHPWAVRVYPGGFFIRHLAFPKNWGMNCKYKDQFSWSHMKREIIMKAGEFLERAGVPRGFGDPDQEIVRVEGVPDKFQQKPPVQFDTVIHTSDYAERDTPRPQVLKEEKNGH